MRTYSVLIDFFQGPFPKTTTMSNCFLCLRYSSNNVCRQCSLTAHPKCWAIFTSRSKNHVDCPVCRCSLPIMERRLTRSKTVSGFYNAIRAYIVRINNTHREQAKIPILVEMFNYIVRNKNTLYNPEYAKFLILLSNKLNEFQINWPGANSIHVELFGVPINGL